MNINDFKNSLNAKTAAMEKQSGSLTSIIFLCFYRRVSKYVERQTFPKLLR